MFDRLSHCPCLSLPVCVCVFARDVGKRGNARHHSVGCVRTSVGVSVYAARRFLDYRLSHGTRLSPVPRSSFVRVCVRCARGADFWGAFSSLPYLVLPKCSLALSGSECV